MADDRLIASWERTTAHLRAARAALLEVPEDADRWFIDYLDANELGLAFEVLVEASESASAPQACWAALVAAADEMQLQSDDQAVQTVRRHIA